MTHSLKRAKSRFPWFRMDVPARHRATVGKRSWQHSLETTDPNLAAIRRASYTVQYKAEVVRLDAALAAQAVCDAAGLVSRALAKLAQWHGSLDVAVASELARLAGVVRSSWSAEHARTLEQEELGEAETGFLADVGPAVPAFDSREDRELFLLSVKLLEGKGVTDGIVHQQVAKRLLDRRSFQPIWAAVSYLGVLVGETVIAGTRQYELLAEEYLSRLASHQFTSWPARAREALGAVIGADMVHQPSASATPLILSPPSPPAVVSSPAIRGGEGHPIRAVFAAWREKSKARLKSKDEFEMFVGRFVSLHGDIAVEAITKRHVIAYRNMLEGLPARPKQDVAALPLLKQVEHAKEKKLPLLSPESVQKGISALRSTLSHARDELLIIENSPADGIKVDRSEVETDPVLPFYGDQLAHIFSQPVMVDPAHADEDVFWFLLLAPWTGCRIEETAQLRPENVRREDGIWFMAIEPDPKHRRERIREEGGIQKHAKTGTSIRNVPLHPVLIEAGFLQLTERQRARGASWIFDTLREYPRYEQRGKYMSNKIMRRIRGFGITNREHVYHSFRHSLKGRLRDDEQTKEEISDLLTGHSFSDSVGRKYARGAGLTTLQNAISRVAYPSVDWRPVIAAGLARMKLTA